MKGKRGEGSTGKPLLFQLDGPISVKEGGAIGVHTRIGYPERGSGHGCSVEREPYQWPDSFVSADSLTSTYNRRLSLGCRPSFTSCPSAHPHAGWILFYFV